MDVHRFLVALREQTDDVAKVSLALVGYDLSDTDLRDRLNTLGLHVGHATTDLHVAAKWRNEPNVHSNIIALATGRHPGVSTLAHFPQGNARAFAETLLEWAQSPHASLVTTPAQKRLLVELAGEHSLSPLVSLNGVAEFLAAWKVAQTDDDLDAPRSALPRLGVLPDRQLLSAADSIAQCLSRNFFFTQELTRMSGHRLEQIRSRIKRGNLKHRTRGLRILEKVEELRRTGEFAAYSALEFEDALELLKPQEDVAPDPPSDPEEETQPPQPPRDTLDSQEVSADGGGYLVDGNDQALEEIVRHVSQALTDAVDGDEDAASGQYEVDGQERRFEFDVNRELLTWVRYFCSTDDWGGFYEVKSVSLEAALSDYRQYDPTQFRPEQKTIAHDGELYDVRAAIEEIQKALHRNGVTAEDFCGLWDCIVATRRVVLVYLDLLIHQPMLAVAGVPELNDAAGDLVRAWERFYGKLAQYHAEMHDIDHVWTRMLFEAIASLDVVQIKVNLDSGRSSWKAILLPTHPLHLWRYERMAALARGLKLEGMDRKAVLKQLKQPENYLGVLYLTSFPEGKDGSQALPVARDYRGLAVFENLRNAYSGSDGIEALRRCVRQFAQIYANHVQPLRLALVNPPNASQMLVDLLNDSRGGRRARLNLLVDIYATEDHEARLFGARRFSTEDRDLIEEYLASGQLRLRVHDRIVPLEERLSKFHDKPVHILAVFDEATTAMRQQPGGVNLLR